MSGGRGLPLTHDFKGTALDSAVQAIDNLCAVRIAQLTLCQHLGKLPTFGEEYYSLLESAAITYDAQQASHSARPPAAPNGLRCAYLGEHENLFSDPGPTYESTYIADHDEDFNVDTPLATATTFAMDPSI